jgi:bidirectional [NiFe] hydrogenase diaphorase subunit
VRQKSRVTLEVVVSAPTTLASDDRRWKLIEATMRRHGHQQHALIETLHAVQEAFGFLEIPALRAVARALHVPLSRVYGVATFYHLFTLKPSGVHTCVVCTGTACHVKGANGILGALLEEIKLSPGQTTPGNEVSLLTARCLGACGLAPAAVFDGEVLGKLTPDAVSTRVGGWMTHDA